MLIPIIISACISSLLLTWIIVRSNTLGVIFCGVLYLFISNIILGILRGEAYLGIGVYIGNIILVWPILLSVAAVAIFKGYTDRLYKDPHNNAN